MDLLNYVLISAIVTLVVDKEIVKLDICVIFWLANSDATIPAAKYLIKPAMYECKGSNTSTSLILRKILQNI